MVDDGDFASQDGGCKDLSTGLVYAPDVRALGHDDGVSLSNPQLYCDSWFNGINFGGHNDWRVPTVGEIEEGLANGLNSHLDFFLDGSPDDGEYRWTSCTKKVKGRNNRYAIRFTDGDVQLMTYGPDPNFLVCVRGLPSDNDCPGKKKGGGKGNGHGGGKKNFLSRASSVALLFLPLALVIGFRCVRPRWI